MLPDVQIDDETYADVLAVQRSVDPHGWMMNPFLQKILE